MRAEVLLGQLLCPAALHVLAGGEELLLTAFQDLADALKQGDVRVGQAPLPLAHGGVGDEEALGQLLLGQPQFLAALPQEGPKGFLVSMVSTLLA